MSTDWLASFQRDGYTIHERLIDDDDCRTLAAECDALANNPGARSRSGETYALRNLLRTSPVIQKLASHPALLSLIHAILGPEAQAVRALLFNKTAAANWRVGWHQDVVIPVEARHETPGFNAWSEKEGVLHVEPPVSVLNRMVAARIHLDASTLDNAPLRVLPGSHACGRISGIDWERTVQHSREVTCCVNAGGVLLMRPLLLHASSPSRRPELPRRVIHMEFATGELPGALRWARA